MISSIEGKVTYQSETHVFVHTNSGIGFKVAFTKRAFIKGEVAFFHTSQTFRENGQDLYGFISLRDLEMFDLLCTVKGVGAKSAFSLVNSLGADNIINAISIENKKALTSAPGIGNKAASQIILDLQVKITKINWSHGFDANSQSLENVENFEQKDIEKEVTINNNTFVQDAVMACKGLGFKESDIIALTSEILKTKNISSSEDLIQHVLKEI